MVSPSPLGGTQMPIKAQFSGSGFVLWNQASHSGTKELCFIFNLLAASILRWPFLLHKHIDTE